MLNKKKLISSLIAAGIISANVVGSSFAASSMGEFKKTFEAQIPNSTVVPFILNSEDDRVTGATLKGLYPNASITHESKLISDDTTLKTGSEVYVNGEKYVVVIYGDVNQDGRMTISDPMAVLRHAKALETLSGARFVAADINHSNSVTIADTGKMLRVIAGLDAYSTLTTKLPAEVVESQLGEILTDEDGNVGITMEFDVDPSEFHYTLTDADGKEIDVSADVEDNKVTLSIAGSDLDAGENYNLTVTDKNGKEVLEETFTYRVLSVVSSVVIDGEATGINADNQKALTLVVNTESNDSVDRTVVVTLTDSEDNKVELTGKITNGLYDIKITGNVSSLEDGDINVDAKVYDAEGNTSVVEKITTFDKAVTPATINQIKTTRVSHTNANVTFTTSATKVYYKVVKEGEKTPSVDEIIKEEPIATTTIAIDGLSDGFMYNLCLVTENAVGTKSEVIVAPIAKNEITDALEPVEDIESNENGTFSWTDNQSKVTAYKVELYEDASFIAEKTVNGKTVDFSEEIKERATAATYTVKVTAIGDYKTINNSTEAEGGDLEVNELTSTGVEFMVKTADELKLNFKNSSVNATKHLIQIIKGEYDKDQGKLVYEEENEVFSKELARSVADYSIDVSKFVDGAYQVNVTAIRENSVAYLDSPATSEVYTRVMNGIKSYVINDITDKSATLTITPLELDGFDEPTYKVQIVKANQDGTFADYDDSKATEATFTELKNTSLKTYEITALDENTKYRVYLEVVPKFEASEPTVKGDLVKYVDIQTKQSAFTTDGSELTVVEFASDEDEELTAGKIALSKDGSKLLIYDNETVEATGSNIASVKELVSKLSAGDIISINSDLEISVTIKAKDATQTVSLGDSIKDANLTIVGMASQLIKVYGNVGEGTVTLSGAGTITVQGLTVDSKVVTVNANNLVVNVANGTTVELADTVNGSITVNDVKVNAKVVVTDTNTITIPAANAVAIDTTLDKTIIFEGTHSSVAITSAKDNTITVKTAENSHIVNLTVTAADATVNLEGAYITGGISLETGTIITKKAIEVTGIKITPDNSANVAYDGAKKVTVKDGKTTLECTGTWAEGDTDVAAEEANVTDLKDNTIIFSGKTFKLSPGGKATYTLVDDATDTLTIVLESGTVNIE